MTKLARRLGAFDAALIVMGGIIGSGIFRNPSVVAQRVHTPALILAAWAAGGIIVLLGAFIFAELAARRPDDGGLYAYMRDAFHPVVAFMYGWTLLLVSQSGGAAASAITFAGYLQSFASGFHVDQKAIGAATLAFLTIVNCFGVRAGSNVQNFLMLLKIAAISGLIAVGLFAHPGPAANVPVSGFSSSWDLLAAMGIAMIPVLFAYSGWQTSSFMTGELKNPERTLPLGMIWGTMGVVVLYMLVNYVCVHVLGPYALMQTDTPASDVLQLVLGPRGAQLIAAAVMLSTFGFMSNQILTSPRVYHAMGNDYALFKPLGWVDPRSRVPVVAIALQGFAAIVIALWAPYEQILNYVTSIDYLFFALSAIALFIFRARDERTGVQPSGFSVPGHPYSTIVFFLASVAVVIDTYVKYPGNSLIGLAFLLAAVPIYYLLRAQPRFTKESVREP